MEDISKRVPGFVKRIAGKHGFCWCFKMSSVFKGVLFLGICVCITLQLYQFFPNMVPRNMVFGSKKLEKTAAIISRNTTEIEKTAVLISSKRTAIAVSSCGVRRHESLIMIKSALSMTRETIDFHIFTDAGSISFFLNHMKIFQQEIGQVFSFYVHDVTFPNDTGLQEQVWKNLFRPCASQRLFMPEILWDIDAVIYVDTDVIFLAPPEDLWQMFKRFNSTQAIGIVPEQYDPGQAAYDNYDLPTFGKKGVNSGVMLINMTRMRKHHWKYDLSNYYTKYQTLIRYGDQDLINVFLHFHPQLGYLLPCEFNFRPDLCVRMITCKHVPRIVHGNGKVFHTTSGNPEYFFRVIYEEIDKHKLGKPLDGLVEVLCDRFTKLTMARCARTADLFIDALSRYTESHYINNSANCMPKG